MITYMSTTTVAVHGLGVLVLLFLAMAFCRASADHQGTDGVKLAQGLVGLALLVAVAVILFTGKVGVTITSVEEVPAVVAEAEDMEAMGL